MTATATSSIILVVNDAWEQPVSLGRAIGLLLADRAEIIEAHEGAYIRSSTGEVYWPMPKVLRLIRYVKVAYDKIYGPPTVSKRGVLDRDDRKCAYCGGHASTVDHVLPRSRGGKTSWKNLVAACNACNNRKRDRTPAEANMTLKVTPYGPKRRMFPTHGLVATRV